MGSTRLRLKAALGGLLFAGALQTTGCTSSEALVAMQGFSQGLLAAAQVTAGVDAKEAQVASVVFQTLGSAVGASAQSVSASLGQPGAPPPPGPAGLPPGPPVAPPPGSTPDPTWIGAAVPGGDPTASLPPGVDPGVTADPSAAGPTDPASTDPGLSPADTTSSAPDPSTPSGGSATDPGLS